MNIVKHKTPTGILQNYVTNFSYKIFDVAELSIMPARTDQFMEFYLEGRYRVVDKINNSEFDSPSAIFIGHQTQYNWDLKLEGKYKQFFIHFTPNGFYRIFNIPMKEFTNRALDLHDFINDEIKHLHNKLCACDSFDSMIILAEEFLIRQLSCAKPLKDNLDEIINYINLNKGMVDLSKIVSQSNLCLRQFERKFDEQIGVSPKTFMKKLRLNYIIQLKKSNPNLNWTELTYTANYFDQAHMIKDFKALTGLPPSKYFQQFTLLH